MVGYAVSGFVDGFFKGRNWRDAKDQRKKDEERQTRLDKMNEDLHGLRLREFGLREEEFGLRREDVMRQRAEEDRTRELQAADDAFRSRVMSTAPGAMGAIPSQRDMGVISIGEGPQLSLGVSTGAPTVQGGDGSDAVRGGAGNDVFSQITNVQPVQGTYDQPANDFLLPLGDGRFFARRAPRDAAEKKKLADLAKAGQLAERPRTTWTQPSFDAMAQPPNAPFAEQQGGMTSPERGLSFLTSLSSGVGNNAKYLLGMGLNKIGFPELGISMAQSGYDGVQAAGDNMAQIDPALAELRRRARENPLVKRPSTTQPAVVPPDAGVLPPPVVAAPQDPPPAERPKSARQLAFEEARASGTTDPLATMVDPVFTALGDFGGALAGRTVEEQAAIDAERAAAAAGAGPAFETKGRGTAPAPVAAAEQTAATSPAAQASTEATKQGVALTFGDLGLKPGDRYTGQQVQAASKSAADWYYETAAPQFLEYYVSTGQMDKAQAFADLLESRAGRKAMELRAGALFKAINGDIDAAVTDALSAYKAYGFVDPTFDIDEEATGIIRDENGGWAGARAVFKDRKTGNTMEKFFNTEAELIDFIAVTTDPGALIETASAQRPEPKGVMTQSDIMSTAVKVMEANNQTIGATPMTLDQAVAAVTSAISGGGLGTLGASQGIDPRITGAGNDGLYSIN